MLCCSKTFGLAPELRYFSRMWHRRGGIPEFPRDFGSHQTAFVGILVLMEPKLFFSKDFGPHGPNRLHLFHFPKNLFLEPRLLYFQDLVPMRLKLPSLQGFLLELTATEGEKTEAA